MFANNHRRNLTHPFSSCLSTCRQAQFLAPIFLFSSEKQTSAKQPPPSRFEISAIFQPYLPPTSRSPFVRFLSRRLSIAVLANDACRASRPTPNIHLPLRNLRDSLSNGEKGRERERQREARPREIGRGEFAIRSNYGTVVPFQRLFSLPSVY